MSRMVRIYHNPRCSKSRATLALLQAQGVEIEEVRYLETPPDSATLKTLVRQLGMQSARELMRQGEVAYAQQDLANPALSEDRLLQALVETPILLERPIVVNGDRARIGRPPEAVLAIL
ncbi:arsenate reductase (glutaredoxin) [Pantoea sp.]|uniref:arsenate reductase (glutaredoxin) n=1 Tax=Pantoea sp. TaxID=69393 RepID=UPI0031DB67A5